MSRRWLLAFGLLLGCGSGTPPDIIGLTDQVAVVGQQFMLELAGVDPDGDSLSYRVSADLVLEGSSATMTQLPSGAGLFRWTPLAADVGTHNFDFTVSDGSNDTTVTIAIEVRSTAAGIPQFREPLGSGRVITLANDPCTTVDILVEDQDTAQVTIAEEEPLIAGAIFDQLDGTTARWMWCPTPAQVAEADRYTLILSADDGENPKAIKNYVIVISGGNPGGPGLVLNEVDYDIVGTDTTEYIELFNPSAGTTSLAGLALVLVNGATSVPYQTIDLSVLGQLGPGKFLVVAGPSVNVPASALKLDPLWSQDQIQNGAPDGIALVDDVQHVVLDALSYEGSITMAKLTGFPAPVSLVEGTALDPATADSNTANGTLCRIADTNNSATDWAICPTRTVGTANQP